MPTYEFEDVETGEHRDEFMWWSQDPPPPKIGETIELEGRTYRRVIGGMPETCIQPNIEMTCWQTSGEEGARGASHVNKDGCPVFTSRREIKKFLREQPGATYGDGWSTVKA
jgi:hypothetical protein